MQSAVMLCLEEWPTPLPRLARDQEASRRRCGVYHEPRSAWCPAAWRKQARHTAHHWETIHGTLSGTTVQLHFTRCLWQKTRSHVACASHIRYSLINVLYISLNIRQVPLLNSIISGASSTCGTLHTRHQWHKSVWLHATRRTGAGTRWWSWTRSWHGWTRSWTRWTSKFASIHDNNDLDQVLYFTQLPIIKC